LCRKQTRSPARELSRPRNKCLKEPPKRASTIFFLKAFCTPHCFSQILLGRRRQPLVDELLHAVALRLAGHDISLGIDVEAVQMEELARLASGSADVADLFERRAIQNRDALVRAVRDVDETLLRIGRQRNAECRACPLRFTLDEPFLQE